MDLSGLVPGLVRDLYGVASGKTQETLKTSSNLSITVSGQIPDKTMSDQYPVTQYESADFPRLVKSPDAQNWPTFWARGDINILNQSLLGFFCSNKCTGDAILCTYDLARELRDKGIAVISGFHSTMEKECLDLLLRGNQPIVICPARSISNLKRIPKEWQAGIESGRILLVSPFPDQHSQPTRELAETRNRFVAALADRIFIAHAESGSKTESFCKDMLSQNKAVFLLDSCETTSLFNSGAIPISANSLD